MPHSSWSQEIWQHFQWIQSDVGWGWSPWPCKRVGADLRWLLLAGSGKVWILLSFQIVVQQHVGRGNFLFFMNDLNFYLYAFLKGDPLRLFFTSNDRFLVSCLISVAYVWCATLNLLVRLLDACQQGLANLSVSIYRKTTESRSLNELFAVTSLCRT